MSDILNKKIVLSLNSGWRAIGMKTVEEAIVSLCSQEGERATNLALDFEVIKDDNGDDLLSFAHSLTWDEWIKLPVRPGDLSISTGKMQIRVPTVIVAVNYDKVPPKKVHVSAKSIYERDGGIDQYTGKPVPRNRATLDHIIPKSRGGKDTFENLVVCDQEVNMAKADRTPSEAGLKLIRKPFAPKDGIVIIRKKDAQHQSWLPFLDV